MSTRQERPRVDLRFGVILPTRCGPDGGSPLACGSLRGKRGCCASGGAACVLCLARRAEALGFDSVWAGESIVARPRLEPLTVLAAIAGSTERIELGTGVMLPALHAPLQLAQRLATLDLLSGGRLVVGAGIGIDNAATRREFAAAGVPFAQRVGRLVATLHACRTLWSTRDADLADDAPGRATPYWDLRGVALEPKPHRAGGPPFWMGSTFARPATLARVGRLFDGWLPTAPDAEQYAAGWQAVADAADAAGRKRDAIAQAVYLTVSLDDDAHAAEERLAPYMQAYYGLPYDVMRKVQGVFAGTAEDCAAWIAGYVRAGARHVVLRSPDLDGQLEAIALEVVPRVLADVAKERA
jgi:alkanesulfonate monooxygenase SsuD/methylene tetrahydromethanopterin reductase-like flavin-dependent oxidoreductase (luciferase family)